MPSPDRFLTAIAGLVVLVLVGCTAAAPQSTSTPRSAASSTPGASSTSGGSMLPSAAPPGASALAASPSTAAGSRPATGDSWLVVGRAGVPGTRVILASTGEVLYDLPDGVPDATWGRVLAATADGTTTTVRDLVVQPGFGGSTRDARRSLAAADDRLRPDPGRRIGGREDCSSLSRTGRPPTRRHS